MKTLVSGVKFAADQLTLLGVLLSIFFTLLAGQQTTQLQVRFRKPQCSSVSFLRNAQPVASPLNFRYLNPKAYTSSSSFLQIFTSAQIECDGWVRGWRFVPINPLIYGLHIGVFRVTRRDVNANPIAFKLINQTYLDIYEVENESEKIWIQYCHQSAALNFKVRAGDYIGIFYDDLESISEILTIPSVDYHFDLVRDNNNNKMKQSPPVEPTYVFPLNSADVAANRGELQVTNAEAQIKYRRPALTALVFAQKSALNSC